MADPYMNDLYRFDPETLSWTDLTNAVSGTPPQPMARMGFAAVGNMLYVHGGDALQSPGQDCNANMAISVSNRYYTRLR